MIVIREKEENKTNNKNAIFHSVRAGETRLFRSCSFLLPNVENKNRGKETRGECVQS